MKQNKSDLETKSNSKLANETKKIKSSKHISINL